jgi:hypothetical protein
MMMVDMTPMVMVRADVSSVQVTNKLFLVIP